MWSIPPHTWPHMVVREDSQEYGWVGDYCDILSSWNIVDLFFTLVDFLFLKYSGPASTNRLRTCFSRLHAESTVTLGDHFKGSAAKNTIIRLICTWYINYTLLIYTVHEARLHYWVNCGFFLLLNSVFNFKLVNYMVAIIEHVYSC